ncbi:MAG: hypothetical protein ABJM36_10840 [Algibacter sp.]|uniref:hypothetical protein n=1 Tax=Algibacter sp. TaxID=1872428 RepID=UPI003299B317
MSKPIKCNKTIIWLEENILFCKFIGDECNNTKFSKDCLEEYIRVITEISDGSYFPLVIDLKQLKNNYALSVIKTMANHLEFRSAILSKSFVVNSFYVQFAFIASKVIQDPVAPNKVFLSYNKAVAFSLETNQSFNALY